MDAFVLNKTKFVRSIMQLRTIVFYIFFTLIAINKPANAEGFVNSIVLSTFSPPKGSIFLGGASGGVLCGSDATFDGVGNKCATYFNEQSSNGISYSYTGYSVGTIAQTGPMYATVVLLFTTSNGSVNQYLASILAKRDQTCPPNATGVTTPDQVRCTCDTNYKPDFPNATNCVPDTQDRYTITLTPATVTIEPSKTYSFTATVTNQDGNAPSKPVPVSVKVDVDPTSGGHDHGETVAIRHKGNVSPASGSTMLPFKFTATEISGTHTITATCDQCVNKTATAKVEVKVDGLTTLTSSSAYTLVGGESGKKHTDNHYLSAEAKGRLEKIVDEYNQAYPKGPLLRLNDASLEWGGKFDIAGKWVGEHAEHRRGVVIDIRANLDATAIPEIRFFDFEDIAAEKGVEAELHCSKEFSKYIVGCIADSGSNRHFHVRLLGSGVRF